MKQHGRFLSALAGLSILFTSLAYGAAAEVSTYQVTGPIKELTPTSITVQKGNEEWSLARGKDTKVKGALKVGATVTIYYQLVATEIESKTAATKASPAKSAAAKSGKTATKSKAKKKK